ncbi:energy transducer TonB family protein [Capnocytophaga cynodegmi]|uniref:energy transducer TonB family protein n=1 Tax=Capnocytophaga cynodegmi TaxID=28189 RepID=UPI00385FA53B
MKTINDLYENRHKPYEIEVETKKTINQLFEEKVKEKETLNEKKVKSDKKVVFFQKKCKKTSGFRYEVEYFFSLFSDSDKSITVTLFIMFCLVVSLLVIQLQNHEKEIMIEMSHISDLPEEIEEKPKEIEELTETPNNTKVTLSAYNESDMNLQHSEDAHKSLDEILAEREMMEANEELLTSNAPKTDLILPTNIKVEEKALTKNDDVVNKNALVKYALTDRTLREELPNPIFTCERYGRVVVIIKVDESGNVIEATIDKVNSTTSDGCLLDNSLSYAQQARFNSVQGRGVQVGTITYSFQQKR